MINSDRRRIYHDNGWGRVRASSVEVFEVPGDHDNMVLEPNVRILAANLRRCIETARRTIRRASEPPPDPESARGAREARAHPRLPDKSERRRFAWSHDSMSSASRLIYGTLSLERLAPSVGVRLDSRRARSRPHHPRHGAALRARRGRRDGRARPCRPCGGRAPIATKCGIRWDHEHGAQPVEAQTWAGECAPFACNGLPASVREEVHSSLRRLRLECIDVVQVHQYDATVPSRILWVSSKGCGAKAS